MKLAHPRTTVVSIFVLLILLVGAGPAMADGEAPEKKADKTDETAKEAAAQAPVSPIFTAAQDASANPQKDDEAVVITNDDLERMMAGLTPEQKLQGVYQAERHIGTPAPAAAGKPAEATPGQGQQSEKKPQSSLEWMEERNAAAQENGVEHVDTEQQVAELSAKVASLEKRLLALKNPLLPRSYADKKDEEDKDWDQKSNLQRVEATQKALDDARAELAAAQAKAGRGR